MIRESQSKRIIRKGKYKTIYYNIVKKGGEILNYVLYNIKGIV